MNPLTGPQAPASDSFNSVEMALSAGGVLNGSIASQGLAGLAAAPSLDPNAVTIALAIPDTDIRQHIKSLLEECEAEASARTSAELAAVGDIAGDQAGILEWLRIHFAEPTVRPVILISTLLKAPTDPADGFLNREIQLRFGQCAIGTIAVQRSPVRVTDIDRAVAPNVTRTDLTHALVMLLGRLQYLVLPVKSAVNDQQSIVIRPLRAGNEAEFRTYFQLRHRVYSQMGYLEEDIERSVSKMEINAADLHSMHLGAYHRSAYGELLVGSARVVTNTEADPGLEELFETIAGRDDVVRRKLTEPYNLGLPIFQTYRKMNPIMTDIFKKNLTCGELSRVIVDQEFRGGGISTRLVSEAVERAVGRGITRMFLECLKIHEPLYEKHGFRRMPGFEASVIDVKRTMIAMELQPEVIARIAEKLN
jgi:GNAT superfamily N-acetyltransferase